MLRIIDAEMGKVVLAAATPWIVGAQEWMGLAAGLAAVIYAWLRVYYLYKNKGEKR